MPDPTQRFACLGLLALLTACGGAPPPRGVGANTGQNSTVELPTAGRFYTPGLPFYGAPTGLGTTQLEREVRAKLTRTLQPPPAVDCLAREYAARFAVDGRDPDPATIQSLAHHCGYWGVPRDTYSVTAPDRETLATHLTQLPIGELTGAVGVGVAEHPDGKVTVSLLAAPAAVRIEPVARTLGTGAIKVQGRILRGDGQTEVWIGHGAGAPEKLKITSAPTGEFAADVKLERPGPMRIEVVRRTGSFRATVALMLLYERLPDRYPPFSDPGPRDHAALVAAINGARKAKGLTPLTHRLNLDSRLDGWLERAVAAGGPTQAPAGMSESDGMAYAQLTYAFARGADAKQAVELLSQTPTGQRAIYDAVDNEVAVGMRPFPRGVGFDAVIVALRRFERLAGPVAREIVSAKLGANRRARGVEPLRVDGKLQALAESTASSVMTGTLPWKQVVPTLMSQIRERGLARGSFGAGAFTVAGPGVADFLKEQQAMAAEMRFLGLGVMGGVLPGDGVPRYIVIYVVAQGVPGES